MRNKYFPIRKDDKIKLYSNKKDVFSVGAIFKSEKNNKIKIYLSNDTDNSNIMLDDLKDIKYTVCYLTNFEKKMYNYPSYAKQDLYPFVFKIEDNILNAGDEVELIDNYLISKGIRLPNIGWNSETISEFIGMLGTVNEPSKRSFMNELYYIVNFDFGVVDDENWSMTWELPGSCLKLNNKK